MKWKDSVFLMSRINKKGGPMLENKMIKKTEVLVIVFLLLQSVSCKEEKEYAEMDVPGQQPVMAVAELHFGKAPLEVKFDTTGSYISQGRTQSFLWNFDDGNVSEDASPEHTFKSPGTYMVTVTAIDSSGAKHTSPSLVIIVGSSP
jgi:hypothetical protein